MLTYADQLEHCVDVALQAYDNGYRIIAGWFNEAFTAWNVPARITADPPAPNVTLDRCRCQLSNALVGLRPLATDLPFDEEIIPWCVGYLGGEGGQPSKRPGGIGLRARYDSPWDSDTKLEGVVGSKEYHWKDSGQWRVFVVEPVEQYGESWRKWLEQFAMKEEKCSNEPPVEVPRLPEMPDNIFRRCGGPWQVRFEGREVFNLLPWVGVGYIREMLLSPGEPRPVMDIISSSSLELCDHAISQQEAGMNGSKGVSPFASLGNIATPDTIKEYKEQLKELKFELANARRDNNNVTEAVCEHGIAILTGKIKEILGIGGRPKQTGNILKNMQDSFRKNVKKVIEDQIKATDPALAEHFEKCLSYGGFPTYSPATDLEWETNPVRNR